MVPYCYLFLLSVFILWFPYYVSDIFWLNLGSWSGSGSGRNDDHSLRPVNDSLSGKELFIRFTAHAFRKLLSNYVFSYFPFGFEGRVWDLIVSVPDHCLSLYLIHQWFYAPLQLCQLYLTNVNLLPCISSSLYAIRMSDHFKQSTWFHLQTFRYIKTIKLLTCPLYYINYLALDDIRQLLCYYVLALFVWKPNQCTCQ